MQGTRVQCSLHRLHSQMLVSQCGPGVAVQHASCLQKVNILTAVRAAAGTMPHDALLHQGKPGALVLPPFQAPAYATPQQRNMALFTRRSHPLYRDVTFRLLSEVINSRLFRTVRAAPVLVQQSVLLVASCSPRCSSASKPAPTMAVTASYLPVNI